MTSARCFQGSIWSGLLLNNNKISASLNLTVFNPVLAFVLEFQVIFSPSLCFWKNREVFDTYMFWISSQDYPSTMGNFWMYEECGVTHMVLLGDMAPLRETCIGGHGG